MMDGWVNGLMDSLQYIVDDVDDDDDDDDHDQYIFLDFQLYPPCLLVDNPLILPKFSLHVANLGY